MVSPTLTLSIETRDAEIGARRMDQALRLVRTGAKATEDVVDKMADKLSRVGGSSNLVTAIGRGVETSVQRARAALMDLERTADRTVSGLGRTISAERQAIDDVSGRLLGIGTLSSTGARMLSSDLIQHAQWNSLRGGFTPVSRVPRPNPFDDLANGTIQSFGYLMGRQAAAINGFPTYYDSGPEGFIGKYAPITDSMHGSFDSYLVNQGNIFDLIGTREISRINRLPAVFERVVDFNNNRGESIERAVSLAGEQMAKWRRLVAMEDPAADQFTNSIFEPIHDTIRSVRMLHGDLQWGLFNVQDLERRSLQDPNATGHERELLSSLISDISEGEQIVGGWLAQLEDYSGELLGAAIAANSDEPRPDPPPPWPRRDPFGSFGAISPDLFVLDKAMLGDGIGIADIHENFPALEPVRVPLELDIAGLEPLTERQLSDLRTWTDLAMTDLQQDYDEALPELAGSIVNRDGGRADSLATGLSQMTGISTRALSDRIAPVLGDEADAFARNLVEAWRRAYFEALVDTIGESERQGAAVDGTDLGFRDVGQSILDGQLAASMVTADMLPVGGLEAVVPTPEEVESVMAMSEALRAQSGALDEGYTPATKGAAEATMELADATVGLDAALKAPDPAAMAEDMEELSALGQQVGNSFASAFERAVFSGEELSDVLSALALDLARLVLQQQVLGPLAGGVGSIFDAVFGAILGVPGGSVGGVTQGGSTSLHTGGLVAHGAPLTRTIAPSVWLGASRYHFGGLAGDEVPAILRRGEEVLTRDDPRHRANGGLGGGMAGGGVTIHQTISIDAKAVNENGVDGAAADAVGRQMRAAVRSAVQREIAQQSRVGGMLNRV